MKRKLAFLFICFGILSIVFLTKFTNHAKGETEQNVPRLLDDAKSGILIEFHTGKVLYEQDPHLKRSPASMTKIMSMYLVTKALDEGKINWDDIITVSAHAAGYGGSQIYLAENEKMSVEDLYKAMVIQSANDATVALAEAVSGSEELFVEQMNQTAQEMGLHNTVFKDPTGLSEFKDGHYSTAYDMAVMSRILLKEYGDIVLKYTSIYEDYLRKGTEKEFWLVNTNRLIRFEEGVDGLKTGWTTESGYNLTATKLKDNMRLISVVMGNSTTKTRTAETRKLLNYGYSNYEVKEYKPANLTVATYKSIYLKPGKVKVVTMEPVYFVVKKGEALDGFRDQFTYDISEGKYNVGDVIGKYKVIKNGQVVYEVDLTVDKPVEKVNFFELLGRTIKKTIFG